jgi:hypothetical protein
MASDRLDTRVFYSSKLPRQEASPGEREVLLDRVHVAGIPAGVGVDELGQFFSYFGRISDVAIIPMPIKPKMQNMVFKLL